MQVDRELKALEARVGTAEVLVVGTGYAGIELATTVAERLGAKGQVRMVTAGGVSFLSRSAPELSTVDQTRASLCHSILKRH